MTESTAHALIKFDRDHERSRREGKGVAADAGAEIDHERTSKSRGFVASDRFGRRLLDANRLDPHLLAVLELYGCFLRASANRIAAETSWGAAHCRQRAMSEGRIDATSAISARSRLPASAVNT